MLGAVLPFMKDFTELEPFSQLLCFWNLGACAVGVLWSGSLSHFWNRRKEPYLDQIKLNFSVKLLLFPIWVRKISRCRQIELIFLKCHQSKTVLDKQRWVKEIWMFPVACTVTLQSCRINAAACTWQRPKASPTRGFWQKCSWWEQATMPKLLSII